MSADKLKSFILIALALLLSFVLVVTLRFGAASAIPLANDILVENWDGEQLTAIEINELPSRAAIPFANYTANRFLVPRNEVTGDKVRITDQNSASAARRGTYQFIVLNLDPISEQFESQSNKLQNYKKGDGNFHFMLYLPQVWSACAVYVNSVLTMTVGEISDYNFFDYSFYEGSTVSHTTKTQPLYLDLMFSANKNIISPNRLEAAQIVTIHYETAKTGHAGLQKQPFIGSDIAVRRLVSTDEGLLTALSAIAALTLVAFFLLCFIKRTFRFLPQLFIGLGVFGFLLSALFRFSASSVPLIVSAFAPCSVALLLLSSLCGLRPNSKFKYAWVAAIVIAVAHSILSLMLPLFALPIAALTIYNVVALAVLSAITLVFLLLSAASRTSGAELLINPALSIVIALTSAFCASPALIITNPIVWLSAAVLAVMIAVSFRVFLCMEQRNRYLTTNLQTEVSRQTQNLDEIITQRNEILAYVSHDMKKTAVSMERFLAVLRQRESDSEQIKTINIIASKNREIIDDFTELSHYSKLNYFAEPSSEVNINNILKSIYKSLTPDCEANGIILRFKPCPSVYVWAKPNALTAIIKNLVFNAIEHSACKTITLTAFKKKTVFITVTDDGNGIAPNSDVFTAYYPQNKEYDPKNKESENLGLGLYICKNLITTMSGTLSYTQSLNTLTFTITLQK